MTVGVWNTVGLCRANRRLACGASISSDLWSTGQLGGLRFEEKRVLSHMRRDRR